MSAIERKVEASKFVFIGTVKETGASNLVRLPANDRLVLVEIKKVAHGPPAFAGVVGTTVTVRTPPRTRLQIGATKLFFAKRLMYGENLAVEATVIDDLGNDYSQVAEEVQKAAADIERKERIARISKAALVVEGKVVRMQESKLNENYPLSFKSPYWVSVAIQLTKVIKGKYEGREIEVLINKGGEAEEVTPLEIEIGKTGVWLLSRKAIEGLRNEGAFYLIEEPDDFLNSYEYSMLTHPEPGEIA